MFKFIRGLDEHSCWSTGLASKKPWVPGHSPTGLKIQNLGGRDRRIRSSRTPSPTQQL